MLTPGPGSGGMTVLKKRSDDELAQDYAFSRITLQFRNRSLQQEFDQELVRYHRSVVSIWAATLLILLGFVLQYSLYPVRENIAAICANLGLMVPSLLLVDKAGWVSRHFTRLLSLQYVALAVTMWGLTRAIVQQQSEGRGLDSWAPTAFLSLLGMFWSLSHVLHIHFYCILLGQLVGVATWYKGLPMLQYSSSDVQPHNQALLLLACCCAGAINCACLYCNMRKTVQLLVAKRRAADKEKEYHQREIDMRRRYLAQMLHDVGQPITTLTLGNQILRSTKNLSQELFEVLDANACAIEMLSLTRRKTIDYAKFTEEGMLRPQFRLVDIRDIVLNKCQKIMTGYNDSTLLTKLTYHMSDDIAPHIISDRDFLWEMIVNYLSNARKFTHQGKIETTVRVVQAGSASSSSAPGPMVKLANVYFKKRAPTNGGFLQSHDQPEFVNASQSDSGDLQKYGETGLELLVEVSDSGIGIPPDRVHDLFKPFSQLQEGVGGTGLGLYGVHCKAQALGGRAGYRPGPNGEGSVFWFAVPYLEGRLVEKQYYQYDERGEMRQGQLGSDGSQADCVSLVAERSGRMSSGVDLAEHWHPDSTSSLSNSNQQDVNMSPRGSSADLLSVGDPHVLFVDDDGLSRKLMAQLLRGMGCQVQTASDGEEALGKMQAQRYALVVIDLDLPVMDGVAVIKRFRDWESRDRRRRRSQIRQMIVVLSGTIFEADRQRALKAGADGFEYKPVRPAMFRKYVPQVKKASWATQNAQVMEALAETPSSTPAVHPSAAHRSRRRTRAPSPNEVGGPRSLSAVVSGSASQRGTPSIRGSFENADNFEDDAHSYGSDHSVAFDGGPGNAGNTQSNGVSLEGMMIAAEGEASYNTSGSTSGDAQGPAEDSAEGSSLMRTRSTSRTPSNVAIPRCGSPPMPPPGEGIRGVPSLHDVLHKAQAGGGAPAVPGSPTVRQGGTLGGGGGSSGPGGETSANFGSGPGAPAVRRLSWREPRRRGSHCSEFSDTVLLVEDEKSIAKLTKKMLEKQGWRVEWASDGKEGLERMQHRCYYAILTDLLMPVLDGFDMVEQFRNWESEHLQTSGQYEGGESGSERCSSRRRQFIAALSACSNDDDRQRASSVGIDMFLSKPVQVQRVVAMLEERKNTMTSDEGSADDNSPTL